MIGISDHNEELRLQGVSICPGIAIGRVRTVDLDIHVPQDELDSSRVGFEQDRYSCAVDSARRHLPEHVATVHGELSPEAEAIFQVHEAILSDESFHRRVQSRIAAERKPAEFCLDLEAAALIAAFDAMRDPTSKREVKTSAIWRTTSSTCCPVATAASSGRWEPGTS